MKIIITDGVNSQEFFTDKKLELIFSGKDGQETITTSAANIYGLLMKSLEKSNCKACAIVHPAQTSDKIPPCTRPES